ncbi:hypothetical protein DW036_08745 [Bacteroides sp. AF39-11AC]|nr:hypothetical protein DW036_08745 [Bacteroides sp. AF39-11AC]
MQYHTNLYKFYLKAFIIKLLSTYYSAFQPYASLSIYLIYSILLPKKKIIGIFATNLLPASNKPKEKDY